MTVWLSGRARYLAVTAVAAPLRKRVTRPDSITASGTPLVPSHNTIKPMTLGSPKAPQETRLKRGPPCMRGKRSFHDGDATLERQKLCHCLTIE